jgi:hypothetical protein
MTVWPASPDSVLACPATLFRSGTVVVAAVAVLLFVPVCVRPCAVFSLVTPWAYPATRKVPVSSSSTTQLKPGFRVMPTITPAPHFQSTDATKAMLERENKQSLHQPDINTKDADLADIAKTMQTRGFDMPVHEHHFGGRNVRLDLLSALYTWLLKVTNM